MNKCPKCQGEMEEGIQVGYVKPIVWGTSLGLWSPKNSKQVKSYRCKNCGYLENYAK